MTRKAVEQMSKTTVGEISLNVGLKVDYDTAFLCTRLLELYLNGEPHETLMIWCDECGNWDINIEKRETGETDE